MEANTEGRLEEVVAEVDRLLQRHRLLEAVARRQDTPRSALLEEMQHRQNLVELQRRLKTLHPADLGHILESLPIDDRLLVWRELSPNLSGQALTEVSIGVRESLIEHTSRDTLVGMLRELDADDLRYLSESVPADVVDEVSGLLDARDRSWVEQTRAYDESSAARLMTQDVLGLRDSQTVAEAVAFLRRRGRLPAQTDRLFVVDSRNILIGSVGLGVDHCRRGRRGDVGDGRRRAAVPPYDGAHEVAKAFERYDLLSRAHRRRSRR